MGACLPYIESSTLNVVHSHGSCHKNLYLRFAIFRFQLKIEKCQLANRQVGCVFSKPNVKKKQTQAIALKAKYKVILLIALDDRSTLKWRLMSLLGA